MSANFATPLQLAGRDPDGFVAVFQIAAQLWEGDDIEKWLLAPQSRWGGNTSMDLIGDGRADDILDWLETMEIYT